MGIHPGFGMLGPTSLKTAIAAADAASEPILHEIARGEDGEAARRRGNLIEDLGTKQRRQAFTLDILAKLDAGQGRVADQMRDFVSGMRGSLEEYIIRPLNAAVPKAKRLRLYEEVMILNRPGRTPVKRQFFHNDQDAKLPRAYVAIAAVERATILFAKYSHIAIRDCARRVGTGPGQISLEAFIRTMPTYKIVRLTMEPGDVIIMDGNLVHAGDAGRPGSYSARMHWYIQAGRNAKETVSFPLIALGRLFAEMFRA